MHSFDNLSLVLTETKDQTEVKKRNTARIAEQETKQDAHTAMENIRRLSPEQLQKLGKQLKEQK